MCPSNLGDGGPVATGHWCINGVPKGPIDPCNIDTHSNYVYLGWALCPMLDSKMLRAHHKIKYTTDNEIPYIVLHKMQINCKSYFLVSA
jgi:hypothetical protein